MKDFFQFKSILESYVKNVSEDLEKADDDPCWDGYVKLGTKMKDGKEVPNCVPKEETKLDEQTSYESDIDPNKKIVVKGVKGMSSKPFTKKFRNMKAADKWIDDNEDDIEIRQIMNEETVSEAFKQNEPGRVKFRADGVPVEFGYIGNGEVVLIVGNQRVFLTKEYVQAIMKNVFSSNVFR